MLSTPRQLRVSVNRKVLNPQTPGEADNSDFEILSARLVYTKAAFTGKSGHTAGPQPPFGIAISPTHLPGTGSAPSIRNETLTFSGECARLVYGLHVRRT